MKTAETWFDEYAESHQDPTNKFIHWICVPAIFISIAGLLASIPHVHLSNLFPPEWAAYVNYATVVLLPVLLFYFLTSKRLFFGMLLFAVFVIWLIAVLEKSVAMPLWQISLIVFVLAWIGQFIGHKIEGAKPSFFKDLQFLLVGPAWLMGFIYKALGLKY